MSAGLTATHPASVFMTTDAVGGVWNYTLELAKGLSEAGVNVALAILGPAPTAMQLRSIEAVTGSRACITGLPLDWTAANETELIAACRSLAQLAARSRADMAHLHAPALAADGPWKLPVVAVAHSCVGTWWRAVRATPLPHDLAWRNEATRRGLHRAGAIIAPSHSFAAALRAIHGDGFPITVVHNGRSTTASQNRMPREQFVLAVGRLWDEGKNIALLDECAARLNVPVYAAGPVTGPNGATASVSHIHILGPIDHAQLARLYASASLFVSPARYEPFGLAVLEAAMAETPLILSDIPTFRELWEGAAVFSPADDAAALAPAIQDLFGSPERRDELGQAARIRAQRYTADKMVNSILGVYRTLLAGAAGQAA